MIIGGGGNAGESEEANWSLAGVTSISSTHTTTSTTYTTLSTPDRVSSADVGPSGLIAVRFRALWKLAGATNEGSVALFIGGNQVGMIQDGGAPAPIAMPLDAGGTFFGTMRTTDSGLSGGAATGADAETTSPINWRAEATYYEVPEGTHDIEIRYKVNETDGGTLSVKDRKLWVWIPTL